MPLRDQENDDEFDNGRGCLVAILLAFVFFVFPAMIYAIQVVSS